MNDELITHALSMESERLLRRLMSLDLDHRTIY